MGWGEEDSTSAPVPAPAPGPPKLRGPSRESKYPTDWCSCEKVKLHLPLRTSLCIPGRLEGTPISVSGGWMRTAGASQAGRWGTTQQCKNSACLLIPTSAVKGAGALALQNSSICNPPARCGSRAGRGAPVLCKPLPPTSCCAYTNAGFNQEILLSENSEPQCSGTLVVAFTIFLVPSISSISGMRNWIKLLGILTFGHLQQKMLRVERISLVSADSECPGVAAPGFQGPFPLGKVQVTCSTQLCLGPQWDGMAFMWPSRHG